MLPCAQKAKSLEQKAFRLVAVQVTNKTNKTAYHHNLNIIKNEIKTFLKNVIHHHHLMLPLPVKINVCYACDKPILLFFSLHLGELGSTKLVAKAVLEFIKLRC